MPERLDGVEAGGAAGREIAEDDADRRREQEGDGDDLRVDDQRHLEELGGDRRQAEAEEDADDAAEQRQHHRLDQELHQHLAGFGADRQADADLARALGHRDQHDVHDADAADQQADAGDRRQQTGEHAGDAGEHAGDLRHVEDAEIVALADCRYAAARATARSMPAVTVGGRVAVGDGDIDQRHIGIADDAALDRLQAA